MKKLLLLLVLVGTLTSCGTITTIPSTLTDKVEVIELATDKNDNFVKANEWMVEAFVNAESVIQFTDKEAGIIKGKYHLHGEVKAIITVRVKDNAAKIEIVPTVRNVVATRYKGYEGTIYANSTQGYTEAKYLKSVNGLLASFTFRMNQEKEDF